MDIKKYLEKLRSLEDAHKKVVLWTIVGILAIIMAAFWFNAASKKVSSIGSSLKTDLPFLNLPSLAIQNTTSASNQADIVQTTTPSDVNLAATKNISEQDAINLVKNLPEVKNWLSLFSAPDGTDPKSGGKPFIDFDHKDDSTYYIHAYVLLPDHAATFNWYDVDMKTGNIKAEF